MSRNIIKRYGHIICQFEKDKKFPIWGIYKEKIKLVQFELHNKESKKKIEKVIDSILKELGMT